jgi:hypothetical protein
LSPVKSKPTINRKEKSESESEETKADLAVREREFVQELFLKPPDYQEFKDLFPKFSKVLKATRRLEKLYYNHGALRYESCLEDG